MPSFQGHPSLRTARLVLPDTALQSVVSLPNWKYLMGLAEGFVWIFPPVPPTPPRGECSNLRFYMQPVLCMTGTSTLQSDAPLGARTAGVPPASWAGGTPAVPGRTTSPATPRPSARFLPIVLPVVGNGQSRECQTISGDPALAGKRVGDDTWSGIRLSFCSSGARVVTNTPTGSGFANIERRIFNIQDPRSNPPTPPFPRPLDLPRVRELRGRWM